MRWVRALLSLPSITSLAGITCFAFTAFAIAACNLENLGDPPPAGELYLPTGLMISDQSDGRRPSFLYVVNSNFDLRYNRGSVQAFDLEGIDDEIKRCKAPGIDCEIESSNLLVDEVLVPSLATSFDISPDRTRMYVATRTDPSLTFIDLNELAQGNGVLRCNDTDRRCGDDHNRGFDESKNDRHVKLPPEPVGIATTRTDDGRNFVLMAHRGGQVSLFYDDADTGPELSHVLAGLVHEPTGIAFDRASQLAYLSVYARNTGTGLSRMLARVGLTVLDTSATSFTYDAGDVVIDGVASQRDTRAIALNTAPDRAGQLLVASRDPASLLFVDVGERSLDNLPATNVPARRIVPVGSGPSRMAHGQIGDRHVVAVSCFDGRSVYIVDAQSAELLGAIHNLSGPFELQIDSARGRLYLADFRSSSVQIIDISALGDSDVEGDSRSDAHIIATLGIPKVVQELQ
jgi:DNA-binding beta-propeller fold protein YncE